jgi:Uma2 family endonuclease
MMSVATVSPVMTAEEFFALPDDGMERSLIRGRLKEKPMTRRNRKHSRAEGKLAHLLHRWLATQPEPRGEILDGEAGFRIRRDPDTGVGIDLAYISAELSAATPEEAVYVDGVPVLAVEILSPSDTQEEIMDKVRDYLSVGVAQVWLVEPVFRTVTVYRSNSEPRFFTAADELTGDPELPGLRISVAEISNK